jgi:hypothetical protein
MSSKDYRKRLDELADKINDETPYEVIMTKGKEMIDISIHAKPYITNQTFQAEHYNFISLTNDSAKTIQNEIDILETYYRHGIEESVTA